MFNNQMTILQSYPLFLSLFEFADYKHYFYFILAWSQLGENISNRKQLLP